MKEVLKENIQKMKLGLRKGSNIDEKKSDKVVILSY